MKFKIGQKVKVIKCCNDDASHVGKVSIIDETYKDGSFWLENGCVALEVKLVSKKSPRIAPRKTKKELPYSVEADRRENGWAISINYLNGTRKNYIAKDLAKFLAKKI